MKAILSSFSCPLNLDVESFLHCKALEFAKHGWAQTHLVFCPYKGKPALVGYFTLANKDIRINKKAIGSNSLRRRISQFSVYDIDLKAYSMATPLIGQLGKNYSEGLNRLISGDELLKMACDKIKGIQFELGGRYAYVECEDKPRLLEFYSDNGFCIFDKRLLDPDEVEKMDGRYLIQLLKYIK